MTYIGIDPGKAGALSVIYEDRIVTVPFDEKAYIDALFLVDERDAVCCLEHVSAMPGNGSVSMFSFGANFGWIQGVLSAYRIPFELVRPAKWKKEFSVTSDKNSSIQVCKRLFPDVSLKRTEKCRTDDDNIAESILMAEYARRHFGR